MRPVKIGFASLNTTVGALRSNTDKVIAFAERLSREQCTIVSFAEQVISGYPVEDLVQWRGFVEAQWRELLRFADALRMSPTVYTLGLTVQEGGHIYNAAAVVHGGKVLGVVPKEKLPTYEVFYEQRTFSSGGAGRVSELHGVPFGDLIFRFPFGTVAVEVCEDLWSADGPARRRAYSGAELVINASASPWRMGIVETRRELISTRAGDHQVALIYVNQVGGQDSLVFDGGGFINQNGTMLAESPRWAENSFMFVLDLERTVRLRKENTTWRSDCELWLKANRPSVVIESTAPSAWPSQKVIPSPVVSGHLSGATHPADQFEELIVAMKTGLAGYFEKTGVFKRIGIALSGGKDSALALLIAWLYARDRWGTDSDLSDFIYCFSMPSRFNSDTTRGIARGLCEKLGVSFVELPIDEAFDREVAATQAMLGAGEVLTPVTLQNIQVRIRAARMWNWANSAHALWLQTGNMSEKAVGYTTVGGDLMGGYSLLGNLPKTTVIALLHYLNAKYPLASLAQLLETKASAELEADQEDERDLMPFAVLDECFKLFAGEKLMPRELYQTVRQRFTDEQLRELAPDYRPGQLQEWVKRFVKLFVASIYKWVQAPQAVHLGSLDLDRERALQLPVVQSREWLELESLDRSDL